MTPTDSPAHALAVYADYVCPFCYLGKASLEQYRADGEDPPDVEWRFFDLRGHKRGPDGRIDHDVDDGKDEAYYARARENVERLCRRYGVEMTLDGSRAVDSWNAHQTALSVRRERGEDAFRRLHDAIFDALWRDGRDVGDPDVLVDVAESVGIEGEAVRAALADEALEGKLREQFQSARRGGVSGVPTFVYGERAARGAVPPEQLRRLVEGRRERPE